MCCAVLKNNHLINSWIVFFFLLSVQCFFYCPSFEGLRTISLSGGWCWWLDLCKWPRSSIGAVLPTAIECRCLWWWCLWRWCLLCSLGVGSVVVEVNGSDRNPTSLLNDVVTMLGLNGKEACENGGGDNEDWSKTAVIDVSINNISESFVFDWFNDRLCRRNLLVFLLPSLSSSGSSSSSVSLNSDIGSIFGMTISWLISMLWISRSLSSSVILMISMTFSVSTLSVSIFFNSIGGSEK